ncbi:MAG: serine hydrolase [Candidatus Firestonebacteria bacterium]
MKDTLDQNAYNTSITTVPAFTLLMERSDGRVFSYSHDDTKATPVTTSSPTTPYESASTSKIVSTVIILRLVDLGTLALTSKACDVIKDVAVTPGPSPWTWPETTVTLQYLLSFLSGFCDDSNTGINLPNTDFAYCVKRIYMNGFTASAGSQFYYSGTHLQIAGLMVVTAAGKPWSSIFADFQLQTGLFLNSTYNLSSTTNPRLAGGMTWTGEDYMAFLKALYWNKTPRGDQLLSKDMGNDLWHKLFANQRGSATVGNSPLLSEMDEDWSYGFGNWLECQSSSYNCGQGHRNSSPGMYGAYPFIDFDYGYFGILARQGPTDADTFPEGINLFRTIQSYATQWSQINCISPSTDLNNIKVYPNPFKIGNGAILKFINLTSNAVIQIYTISGEKVNEVIANSSGVANWNGTNVNGNVVSRGIYLGYISDETRKTIIKIAIIK